MSGPTMITSYHQSELLFDTYLCRHEAFFCLTGRKGELFGSPSSLFNWLELVSPPRTSWSAEAERR